MFRFSISVENEKAALRIMHQHNASCPEANSNQPIGWDLKKTVILPDTERVSLICRRCGQTLFEESPSFEKDEEISEALKDLCI